MVIISKSVRNHHPTTLPSEYDKHDSPNNHMPKLSDFESLTCASELFSCLSKVIKNPCYDGNKEQTSAQDYSHEICFDETNIEASVIMLAYNEESLPFKESNKEYNNRNHVKDRFSDYVQDRYLLVHQKISSFTQYQQQCSAFR